MKTVLTVALLLFVQTMAFAQQFATAKAVPYSENSDEYSLRRCLLDIHHPTDTTGLPVVVWFHGGGLTGGERYIPKELKQAALVVVAPGYRLMPQVDIAACIHDAAAAVAWTFRNIDKFGGDPSKIFVAGHSAGGYLTSMIGLEKKWLEAHGVDADSIRGLVPYSGQAITHFAHRHSQGIPELRATVDEYAPLYHVRPDAPPYIIITGDRNVELFGRYEENAYLWRMLKLVGHPQVEIYEIDGHDHGKMVHPAHHILKSSIRRILERD